MWWPVAIPVMGAGNRDATARTGGSGPVGCWAPGRGGVTRRRPGGCAAAGVASVRKLNGVAALEFSIRPMTAVDAHAVATWRYPDEYSFYDADADPDDLAELLDPSEWGQHYFAADELATRTLAGFLMVKLTGRVAEIGLGLRPDLTGRGQGASFLNTCLHFASAALGAHSYTLAVAAFNRRAITVYERAGFREVDRFEHFTNGGRHSFIRMDKDTNASSA